VKGVAAPQSAHELAASCFAFEAKLLGHYFITDDAQLDCVLSGVVVFEGWEEIDYELLCFYFGQIFGSEFLERLKKLLLGLSNSWRDGFPRIVGQCFDEKPVMVSVLVSFEA
jgi:hypothetical protein